MGHPTRKLARVLAPWGKLPQAKYPVIYMYTTVTKKIALFRGLDISMSTQQCTTLKKGKIQYTNRNGTENIWGFAYLGSTDASKAGE